MAYMSLFIIKYGRYMFSSPYWFVTGSAQGGDMLLKHAWAKLSSIITNNAIKLKP